MSAPARKDAAIVVYDRELATVFFYGPDAGCAAPWIARRALSLALGASPDQPALGAFFALQGPITSTSTPDDPWLQRMAAPGEHPTVELDFRVAQVRLVDAKPDRTRGWTFEEFLALPDAALDEVYHRAANEAVKRAQRRPRAKKLSAGRQVH